MIFTEKTVYVELVGLWTNRGRTVDRYTAVYRLEYFDAGDNDEDGGNVESGSLTFSQYPDYPTGVSMWTDDEYVWREGDGTFPLTWRCLPKRLKRHVESRGMDGFLSHKPIWLVDECNLNANF